MPELHETGGRHPSIHFSPTIELGHVLQALVMLGALGGWAIVGYMTIDKQLAQQQAEMALVKQRMAVTEQGAAELRDTMRQSSIEQRQTLGKITDQLSDLRTLVAGQGRK